MENKRYKVRQADRGICLVNFIILEMEGLLTA